MKYEDFIISMEPPSLDMLAKVIRDADAQYPKDSTLRAELLNLACNIEARMQHLAWERSEAEEDWLS